MTNRKQTETEKTIIEGYKPDKKKFNKFCDFIVLFPNGTYEDYLEYYNN